MKQLLGGRWGRRLLCLASIRNLVGIRQPKDGGTRTGITSSEFFNGTVGDDCRRFGKFD
jgi:hypothetical protein